MDQLTFDKLVKQWDHETGIYSNPAKYLEHPIFLDIIALGEEALPFILREIVKDHSRWWIVALEKISQEQVIPDDMETYSGEGYQKANQMWIHWGINKGYLDSDNEVN